MGTTDFRYEEAPRPGRTKLQWTSVNRVAGGNPFCLHARSFVLEPVAVGNTVRKDAAQIVGVIMARSAFNVHKLRLR